LTKDMRLGQPGILLAQCLRAAALENILRHLSDKFRCIDAT